MLNTTSIIVSSWYNLLSDSSEVVMSLLLHWFSQVLRAWGFWTIYVIVGNNCVILRLRLLLANNFRRLLLLIKGWRSCIITMIYVMRSLWLLRRHSGLILRGLWVIRVWGCLSPVLIISWIMLLLLTIQLVIRKWVRYDARAIKVIDLISILLLKVWLLIIIVV